jgi:hypothetical protein
VTSTLTYLYCLVRSARRPSLRGIAPPVPGGESVRLVDLPGMPQTWLVVSSVAADAYAEDVLDRDMQQIEWIGERAMAHEAVIEHFLRADAVLPMQLFTLFMNDERAVEHVARDRRRIDRILKKVAGKVEWGLRLTVEAAAEPPAGAGARTGVRRVASGAAYLARKRDVRDASHERMKRARADATRIYRKLSAEAAAAERRTDVDRTVPDSRVVLDAAFLVPAGRTAAFRAAVKRHTAPLKQAGVATALSGPWPPYNFI